MSRLRGCGLLAMAVLVGGAVHAQEMVVTNAAGVRMEIEPGDKDPALRVTVPDGPENDRSFKILLPEHVTVRGRGDADARHLYLYRPGLQGAAPAWRRDGAALEYATDLKDGAGVVHMVARATLGADGIVFHYEFLNRGATDYAMVTAITDPRFRAVFYDPRLERTYVHGATGFRLLGRETPERLTMPLKEWFPVRYLASWTAPVPAERVKRTADGITYRYDSERVDEPMVATLSADGSWVAASFARDPGNVWSNPELTCQHVDPERALPAGGRAEYAVKVLIFRGSLDEALAKERTQRVSLP